jgi:hypothetical protein
MESIGHHKSRIRRRHHCKDLLSKVLKNARVLSSEQLDFQLTKGGQGLANESSSTSIIANNNQVQYLPHVHNHDACLLIGALEWDSHTNSPSAKAAHPAHPIKKWDSGSRNFYLILLVPYLPIR